MSRFRVSNAPSDEDRQIAQHVDRAMREIEAALSIARGVKQANFRSRRVERDLRGAMAALDNVSTISPKFGGQEDPDHISEEERTRLARERRAEEREARRNEVIS